MLEKLFAAAFAPQGAVRSFVHDELERLTKGGYLPAATDVERLTEEALSGLAERSQGARETLSPLLRGAAGALREALDIPSRTEVLALTEALRRAQAQQEAGAGGDAPAGGA